MQHKISRLTHQYWLAKCHITTAGFGEEIRWQKYRSIKGLSERDVLSEAAWVILNGGMKERVVRGLFPKISLAFFDWRSARTIVQRRKSCVDSATKTFNHRGKLNAIVAFAQVVADIGHEEVLAKVEAAGSEYLQQMPYLGPATSLHLAKNLGCDVAKPDRHLVRIASSLKYASPSALCSHLASAVGDSIAVVDLVLWRFATIQPNYVAFFAA